MRRLAAKTKGMFGPKPKLMKWTYTGIVRPKLTNGCLVWGHKINKRRYGKKLNRLNRIACMASTSTVRTTPQASLELVTHTHPLDLFIKETVMTAYMRLKSQLDKPWNTSKSFNEPHLNYWSTLCTELDLDNDM